jgi:Arc/MetJ family transcription regulator
MRDRADLATIALDASTHAVGVSASSLEVYGCDMARTAIKRTNINLETDLVDAAAHVLGTSRTTDTVHAALRAVVDRDARARLARRDFPDLTPQALEALRASAPALR